MGNYDDFIYSVVGLPFLDNGRGQEGYDCYGLVLAYYKRVCDYDLPDYQYRDNKNNQETINQNIGSHFIEVPYRERKKNDLLLFVGEGGFLNHLGILITRDNYIHASRSHGVVVVSLLMHGKALLRGVYRLKAHRGILD